MSIRSCVDTTMSMGPLTECRTFRIRRSPDLGFGFVAGSERPTLLKHVTEKGPSFGKLLAGDAIVAINGTNVERLNREQVIAMVKECEHEIEITIVRNLLPTNGQHDPHQQLTTATHGSSQTLNRHRDINKFNTNNMHQRGQLTRSATLGRNHIVKPLTPVTKVSILKVFLENGQTKTFQFDSETTVRDVLKSLNAKLGFKYRHYFGLAVDHAKRVKRNQLHLLDNDDSVSKISKIRDAADIMILYRMTYPPADVSLLQLQDPLAFDYLYQQTCNDIKLGRYLPELKPELIFKLVSIHIVQNVRATSPGLNANNPKIILKLVAKDPGLSWFVPHSILTSTKKKQLAKILLHYIKKTVREYDLAEKSSDAIKLTLLEVVSQLPSYGAKLFVFQPTNSRILINDRLGVCLIEGQSQSTHPNSVNGNQTNGSPISLNKINQISSVRLVQRPEMIIVELNLVGSSQQRQSPIKLSIADEDMKEFVTTLRGYYRAWKAAQNGNLDNDSKEYELPIDSAAWTEPELAINGKDRSITPISQQRQPLSLDNGSSRVSIPTTISTTPRSFILERSDDSEDMRFPPPPPSIGSATAINDTDFFNGSINGSQTVNDDIGTMSEDASVSLEDNSSLRSDLPSDYPDDEHIYANTGRSFVPRPGSHNNSIDDRLHIVYRNRLSYDRTSTPSSSTSGDVTDLTNHRQIQINLDKDRHIIIKQYDVTNFSNLNAQTQTQRPSSEDFDSGMTDDLLTDFIMPPPPRADILMNGVNLDTSSQLAIKASTELLSDNDIRSLIVPPPPPNLCHQRV